MSVEGRSLQESGAAQNSPRPARSHERGRGALRRLLVAGCVAAVVVAADQTTKTWAEDRLSRGSIHVIWKLDLTLAFNSGAAFSLAQGWAAVFAGLAVVAVVVLLAAVRRVGSWAMAVVLGLVAGGALGNLSDRVFWSHHGSVIDFIALHFWPTFNVADSAIVIGTVWAGWLLWRSEASGEDRGVRHRPRATDPTGQVHDVHAHDDFRVHDDFHAPDEAGGL